MRYFLRLFIALSVLTATLPVHAVQCIDSLKVQKPKALAVSSLPASVHARLIEPTVHTTGESGFMAKLKMIENAKKGDRIDLAYFIYESDFSSAYLTRLLIAKANEGVEIRLIVDYFMAEKFKDLYRYLQSHKNIEVYLFRPPSPEFVTFLKNDLQMANAEGFLQGIVAFNKDLIFQSMASSPVLAPLVMKAQGLLAQLMMQKQTGEPMTPEASAAMAQEVAALLLQEIGSGLKVQTMQFFRSHLLEFTRRLHHKLMISGNAQQLTFSAGGRNISDEYHLSPGHPLLKGRNYPFFDAEVSGQLKGDDAGALMATFEKLLSRAALLQSVRELPPMSPEEVATYEAGLFAKADQFASHLDAIAATSAQGTVKPKDSVDIAYSENLPRARMNQKQIVSSLETLFKSAEKEITIVSAYAHLTPEMLKLAKAAAAKGVKISLYTNSFTSTDMNIVNVASYKKFAEWSRELGEAFSLYELQLGTGQGSLHAKTIFVDGKIVGIGSANLDPRSDRLDSNNFVFFDATQDPQLAAQIVSTYIAQTNAGRFTFALPWVKVDMNYVNAMLNAIKEKKPSLLRAVDIQDVVNQL